MLLPLVALAPLTALARYLWAALTNASRAWGCVLDRLLDRLDAGHCDQAKGV
jgi:hypothetical protein